ncbi:hypothetical protein [Streptomyces sp. NPDC060065]|uniref:vWA domain-containing protein n=1 Tax=Streptomyces sp. NPDC060065 TaxID=3347050 RepID=UPI0036A98EA7
MSRKRKQGDKEKPDPAAEAFAEGMRLVRSNRALGAMGFSTCRQKECDACPRDGLVRVDSGGVLHAHPTRRADPAAWAWAAAHGIIHLGFGHVPAATGERVQPDRFDLAARCAVVNRFLLGFPVGLTPEDLPESYPDGDEEQLAARWRRDGIPAAYERCGTAGGEPDQLLVTWHTWSGGTAPDWQLAFAHALTRTMAAAMDMAGGRRASMRGGPTRLQPRERALSWFVSSYRSWGSEQELSPGSPARPERSWAHWSSAFASWAATHIPYAVRSRWADSLRPGHVGVAIGDGEAPNHLTGGAGAPTADATPGVPDRIENVTHPLLGIPTDRHAAHSIVPMFTKTTCSPSSCEPLPGGLLGSPREYVDLDEFYRRGLGQGLDLHQRQERGFLPGGLVEEIRALSHPPLAWDAQLARWFDEFVPRPEPLRTYARPSRRQAATPDIPRAGRYFPPEEIARCTFGVVLDTSASMDRTLLGKALGAIASYAEARDVPAARVVFCDAAPHDAGYLPVTEIAGRVRVRGRGGTVLQPGVDLLHRADDFPPGAPMLVITDGWCDVLRVRREHAYLIPQGARLPFTARGPVFRVS